LPVAVSASARAGHHRRAGRQRARALGAAAHGPAVQRRGHQHEPAGRERPPADRLEQDHRAELMAADQRARAADVVQERAEQIGGPLGRVGVVRAVLGVAVQRQVGEHDPVAVRELVDDGLPLAVREPLGVQERERRPGARLAVGDARAVGVVVEAELHGVPVACTTR
jgi:hypothetical protein